MVFQLQGAKVLIIANLIYGLHQVMTGQIGYYGIRSIVTTAPSACGSVYFTAAILMLYFYYSEDRVSNLCIAVIMFVLAILTISRTYVFASCMFILVLAGMNSVEGLIRKRKVKIIRVAVLSLSIAVAVAACLSLFIASDSVHSKNTLLNVLRRRMSEVGEAVEFRAGKSSYYYSTFVGHDLGVLLIGKGKGITEQHLGVSTLGVDNQYVRSLIEMGLVGIFLWSLMLLGVTKGYVVDRKTLELKMFLSLLVCYLAASFGTELFQTTRPGTAFWLIAGVLFSRRPLREAIDLEIR